MVPLPVMETTSAVARRHGLSIHLDGARIFNAVAASGIPADRFAALSDTVQFCFSKGLGAPVGSILCGPADLIAEARYLRKRLGGAMRQAGVIAAAARIALRDRDRLGEDHELATYLAAELGQIAGEAVDQKQVETNMVQLDTRRLPVAFPAWKAELDRASIKVNPPFGSTIRLVTHRDVDASDADRLVATLAQAIAHN